ncbi:MAG: peptidoglycan DD-metalloendopeptidase family protein [Sulfuriferula sp.]|nr:peptidoglycan DD-metalloendopeptidase family protein [Sulfuriferula sp.]
MNAHAVDAPDLAGIHAKIEQLRQQNQAAEISRNQASDALQQSERTISDANRSLYDLDQQRGDLEQRLAQLRNQGGNTRTAIARQQAALAELMRQQYFSGANDASKLLLNDTNPNQTTRNLTYLHYISLARNQLINDLQRNLTQLDQLTAEQQIQQAQLEKLRLQRAQQRQLLETERNKKQQIVKQLGSQIQQQRQQIATLEQDEKRMTKLMQELAAARKKAEAEAAARAAKAAKEATALAARNEKSAQKSAQKPRASQPERSIRQPYTPDIGLGQLKGRLIMPAHGELIHRFGTQREQGAVWKGLFIKAASGQPVHAVAAGQVVFSDWMRGFGNLIIIDHGGGYMSLYSNNETLYKQTGASVKAGDTVASVGNTGGNSETGLYFELRYQSQAFDPYPWLAK